jgi:dTMP kinase
MTGLFSRGRFITFEGGEGSGKSTQIRHLAKALRALGLVVHETREPGGSPMGERIRSLLLDPASRMDAMSQAFLFCAARHDHVVELIAPALAKGEWVLCDRFADSTRAYQGAAGALPQDLLKTLENAAVGATRPDLTFILDIKPEIGLSRAARRRKPSDDADAFEASDLGFHRRVRDGFLNVAKGEPDRCVVIDADQNEADIAAAIYESCDLKLKLHEMVDASD